MPDLYASGKMVIKFELDKDGVKAWTNKKDKKRCEDYDLPLIQIEFVIDNPEEPISPWMFSIEDKSAYEGQIVCEYSGNIFIFTADGKFKFKVHKDIPGLIESGKVPRFEGVLYLRSGYCEATVIEDTLRFSKKKL